ncbi:MAG: Holliday junction resolvase RuvX [Muribaculaceae bacterium]|nr:Holliday junction resolvase RuvX [Muribaculaceae bacterium]MDE6361037.1 Holliday junction resolvase RuvX [Muribaculaceae bacterium]
MGRLLAIDFGKVRTGIAVSDPMRIVANGLTTVETPKLEEFLRGYFSRESVDAVIVGLPRSLDGSPSDSQRYLLPALGRLRKAFPGMTFEMYDERFTSVLAHRAMLESGMKRSERRKKGTADVMAACIILNDYLDSLRFQ